MNPYIIKQPVVTEKSTQLANEQNVYTFIVSLKASKSQIKSAIEKMFDVTVERVNTLVTPSKRTRSRKSRSVKLKTVSKKAMIKLKQGDSIELFDIGG
ncbi:MAG: 50S ribosomal protein L23 [Patescibacteria group bacterium]|nr:50S ribosomal protein L23 [Patescibacteria group bacterium]